MKPSDEAGVSENGFGLMAIRERVRMIGGELVISSLPGEGTDIELTVRLRGSGNDEK